MNQKYGVETALEFLKLNNEKIAKAMSDTSIVVISRSRTGYKVSSYHTKRCVKVKNSSKEVFDNE